MKLPTPGYLPHQKNKSLCCVPELVKRLGPALRICTSKSFFTPKTIAKRFFWASLGRATLASTSNRSVKKFVYAKKNREAIFFGVVGPCGPGPYRRTTGRRATELAGTANAELAGKANAETGGKLRWN